MDLYYATTDQAGNLERQNNAAKDNLPDCRDFLDLRCSHAVSPSVGLVGQ